MFVGPWQWDFRDLQRIRLLEHGEVLGRSIALAGIGWEEAGMAVMRSCCAWEEAMLGPIGCRVELCWGSVGVYRGAC